MELLKIQNDFLAVSGKQIETLGDL